MSCWEETGRTGKQRLRHGFGGCLVLQIEVVEAFITSFYDDSPMSGETRKLWRDARFSDFDVEVKAT